jgi:DNA-binding MarR family transcriptional regulator
MTTPEQQALVAATWQQVCFHLDGLAIGTSVETINDLGGFAQLAGATEPVAVSDLADALALQSGYLNLVFRLLELQGYVVRSGDVAGGQAFVALTAGGHEWCRHIEAYSGFPDRVGVAQALMSGQDTDLSEASTELPDRLRCHLDGPMAAATMTALSRSELFANATETIVLGKLPHPLMARILVDLGWASLQDGGVELNDAGRLALSFAAQYYYPVSYLPTLAAVPQMLRGMETVIADREKDGREGHVDRELDIAFSGIVFARTCRDPLFDLVLPLFDDVAPDGQPRAIADCGGGDGTLLCELYQAIVARTSRGGVLDAHPLTMIGVEYNPVAERTLRARMQAMDVPGLVFAGDVGDPAAIATRLSAEGFARDDVLHVSKSVFHNRTYAGTPAIRAGASLGAFSGPDGGLLTAGEVEADLEVLFGLWRAEMGRHGMVVIEAHIIEAALATERLGRNVMTSLEASHGYSHQYLVEIDVHRAAARRAGLKVVGRHDFGAAFLGAPIMSIDHYAL